MEQEKRRLRRRAARWERRLLTALATALSAELFVNVWVDNFRVSGAVVLYPVLLVTLMQDSRKPDTGVLTSCMVLLVRCLLGMLGGAGAAEILLREYPGAIFYLCYEGLFCLVLRDRAQASLPQLWRSFWLCDTLSNVINLTLSKGSLPDLTSLSGLVLLGLARSLLAAGVLWGIRRSRRLLLVEEHERRYQRLFLMTANLKNELYFLKKDAENIEGIMTRAYRLYEQLGEQDCPEELRQLALSIARDVHEVKKDNLRIIRGIEGEVEEVYDQEQMEFQDLMHILENSTRRMLGENRASIRLECRRTADFSTQEHYRLLSILKNLVTNAIEAIQGAGGRGIVLVEERVEGDTLFLTVSDDGPGISERSMHNLFQVGYSTKFDPETGNINRGVGLPAVKSLTEELGGSVSVESQPGRGARFSVELPLHRVKGEKREK